MSTNIEWTNETWNPIIGCSKISPGCKNCYAEKMAGRLANIKQTHNNYSKIVIWGVKDDNYYGKPDWNGKTHFCSDQVEKPFTWKKPRKIFVCSMGDLFHESVPFKWIDQVFEVIVQNQQHTFQILTKRPEQALKYFQHLGQKLKNDGLDSIPSESINYVDYVAEIPNLWIGVTCEDQQRADVRISILLKIPAKVQFLSCEPLISNIDFTKSTNENLIDYVDWVICGPETGPNARPMEKEWIDNIYQQCKKCNIPFFDKKNILQSNIKQFPKK